ncbi:hypothetical protein N0M98_11540 [Paenibacillus doosanensis]|nr:MULTISPECIES: hypothetical protein [Paenibacillus]MCS7460777.1 hypothetical protein [Paenibacillus doosanensis]
MYKSAKMSEIRSTGMPPPLQKNAIVDHKRLPYSVVKTIHF